MYDRVLVPLDGSKIAEAVIPSVTELILGGKDSREIEITLLQVVSDRKDATIQRGTVFPTVVYVTYSESEMEQIKSMVTEYLEKVGSTFKIGPHVTIKTLVRFGVDVADQILKVSDETRANLIAISTHGRSGLTRWALGSVADKILRGGNIPVLMVRAEKQPK